MTLYLPVYVAVADREIFLGMLNREAIFIMERKQNGMILIIRDGRKS
jgi:hypothetical protein